MKGFPRRLVVYVLWLGVGLAALGLSPVPKKLPDSEISEAIKRQLSHDPGVESDRIDVSTVDGIVTLKGAARNILEKDRTKQIATTIRGVRAVIDRIVAEPLRRKDDEIQIDVRRLLLTNPATNVEDVDVEVNRGTVHLSGTVHSWQKRRLIETLVKGVKGIRQVFNDLSVSVENRRKDSEIRSEIKQILRWDVRVDHALIDVYVSRGLLSSPQLQGRPREKLCDAVLAQL